MNKKIEIDDETQRQLTLLKAKMIEQSADPLDNNLAVYFACSLVNLIDENSPDRWQTCLSLAIARTYKRKQEMGGLRRAL